MRSLLVALIAIFSAALALPSDTAADCSDRITLSATPEGEAVAARGVAYVRSIESDSQETFLVNVNADLADGTQLLVFANGESAGTINVAGGSGTLTVSAPLSSGMDSVCTIGPVWVTDAATTVLIDGTF